MSMATENAGDSPIRNSLGWLRGTLYVAQVAARRMFWSRQTIVSLVMLLFSLLVVFAWGMDDERTSKAFMMHILFPIYLSFLLPVFCLSYATACIAGDREEQTLIYLLCTPLPRAMIYLAKYLASLAIVSLWTLGSLTAIAAVAGDPAWPVYGAIWPIAAISTVAYVALFQLFSVALRRATIVGLCYALFLETFLGNMPGIAKRVAISFYAKCLFFDAGKQFGVSLSHRRHAEAIFAPIAAEAAWTVLAVLSVALIVCGVIWFSRREYHD